MSDLTAMVRTKVTYNSGDIRVRYPSLHDDRSDRVDDNDRVFVDLRDCLHQGVLALRSQYDPR